MLLLNYIKTDNFERDEVHIKLWYLNKDVLNVLNTKYKTVLTFKLRNNSNPNTQQ